MPLRPLHIIQWSTIFLILKVDSTIQHLDGGNHNYLQSSQNALDTFLFGNQILWRDPDAASNLYGHNDDEAPTEGLLNRRRRGTNVDSSTDFTTTLHRKNNENLKSITSKTLSVRDVNSAVDVTVSVASILASSLVVNLNMTVTDKENTINFIGVKVKYRSFGSILEKERLLIVRNTTVQVDKFKNQSFSMSTNDSYLISNLYTDTGYILCFSLITKQNKTRRFVGSHLNPRRFSPLGIREGNTPPFSISNKIPGQNTALFSLPHITTELSVTPNGPRPSRRNYAYSSTGELIYLPSSSWVPHSSRSKRSEDKSITKYCLEVQTLSRLDATLNPLYVLIISMSFLGVLVLALVVFLLWRSSCLKNKLGCVCKCRNWQKQTNADSKSKCARENLPKDGEKSLKENMNTSHQSDCVYNKEYGKIQESGSLDCELSIIQVNPKCKRTYVKSEKLNELKKLKRPPRLCLHSNRGNNTIADFHPGYEVPPTSTVEVFGYDFPKQSSKGVNIPPCTTPSTCDLNDNISDTSWDNIYARFNLDMPRTRYKRSEITKNINSPLYLYPHSNKYNTFHHKTPNLDVPQEDQNREFILRTSTNPTFESCRVISDEAFHLDNKKVIENLDYDNDRSSDRLKSTKSLGDVTVTGGTLIEVPEGYVIPQGTPIPVESSVVRIVVS